MPVPPSALQYPCCKMSAQTRGCRADLGLKGILGYDAILGELGWLAAPPGGPVWTWREAGFGHCGQVGTNSGLGRTQLRNKHIDHSHSRPLNVLGSSKPQ